MRLRLGRRHGADDGHGFRKPSRAQLVVLAGYLAAAAVYVLIGVLATDFLLSYFVGLAYLLVAVWLVPRALRRFL